jgi:dTDP-4-amino-4,6-dideoxygalactose transaminase
MQKKYSFDIEINTTTFGVKEFMALANSFYIHKGKGSKYLMRFEDLFSSTAKVKHSVAVSSATSGLTVVLQALGIGRGDEVIVPAFSFIATASTVKLSGATPVFADIDLAEYTIDVKSIEALITSRTKAIIPVHLYGLPAKMEVIKKVALKHGIYVIEDAAQAHGAKIRDVPVGNFGDAAVFSFYASKNISSLEGGIISTNSADFADTVRIIRNQGMDGGYDYKILGFNARMTELQAALAFVQTKRLESINNKRRRNADFYRSNLKGVLFQSTPSGYVHAMHQFTIRIPSLSRNLILDALKEKRIEGRVYYPRALNDIGLFGRKSETPNSQVAAREVFSIPVHSKLQQSEMERVCEVINSLTH